MRTAALAVLTAVLVAAPGALFAQQPATLADLSWFAGRWVDDAGGNLSEENWTAPSGDSMQGMWRYVSGGKARIYELLTITAEDGGIVMRLRHFDPKLVGREDKTAPLALKLVSWKSRAAVFEGPAVGAAGLVRLSDASPSDDTFVCTLDKEGKKEEYSFRRAAR
jgi:hypothetical protein